MGKGHELNPMAAAVSATLALALFLSAGIACDFLEINAVDGDLLEIIESSSQSAQTSSSVGILCQGDFYSLDDDQMWSVARIFFFASLATGATATCLAWAICTCTRPTRRSWLMLSILSALSSVMQVPVFILFEVEPCVDFKETQKCSLSKGAFLCIASVFFWLVATLITQLLDPPAWVSNLQYWRRTTRKSRSVCSFRTRQAFEGSSAESETEELSLLGSVRRWTRRRRWAAANETFLGDEEEGVEPEVHIPSMENTFSQELENARAKSLASFSTDSGVVRSEDGMNESFDTESPMVSGAIFRPKSSDASSHEAAPFPEHILQTSGQTVSILMTAPAPVTSETLPPEIARSLSEESQVVVRDEPLLMSALQDESVVLLPAVNTTRDSLESRSLENEEPHRVPENTNTMDGKKRAIPAVEPDVVKKEPGTEDSSLGSLVSKITGAESVLDNPTLNVTAETEATPESTQEQQPSKEHDAAMEKKAALTAHLVRKLHLAKPRGAISGYRFMDDSDIESSYPMSPPIEIMVDMTEDSQKDKLHGARPSTTDEKKLLHQWDKLHLTGSLLDQEENGNWPFVDFPPITKPPELSEPEPLLHFSDDSDSEESEEDQVSAKDVTLNSNASARSLDPSKSRKGSKTLQTKRRRKKKTKAQSVGSKSVASSPSLLDTTIAEETVEDVEGEHSSNVGGADVFDPYTSRFPLKRSLSAPNLAAFCTENVEDSRLVVDLVMTGMNAYSRVETWRGDSQKEDELSNDSSSEGNVKSAAKSTPSFIRERELRRGIHATQTVSSDSSESQGAKSNKTSPSRLSREARIARLRQQRSRKVFGARPQSLEPPVIRRHPSLPTPATPASAKTVTSVGSNQGKQSITDEKESPVLIRDVQESHSMTPKSHSMTPGLPPRPPSSGSRRDARPSLMEDETNQIFLDEMELQLAELRRPDGDEYGEDEVSL